MGADIKLKDLFGQTQTEQDISTVSVPKADGTGREFYVKRPVIYYNLVASPPYAPESTEHIFIFWNLGDGPLWGDVPNDRGNCAGEVYAPIAGKTTKPFIYIQVEKYLQGVTADNTGKAVLKLLQDTCRNKGKTVVVITHNQALTAMADRVITVKNGTVTSMNLNEHIVDIEQIEW